MIKIIFLLMLFIFASVIFGANFSLLFDMIAYGGTILFKPINMFIELMNATFIAVFRNYYVYLLLSIFIFIILFGLVISFFVGNFQKPITMNKTNNHKVSKNIQKMIYADYKAEHLNPKSPFFEKDIKDINDIYNKYGGKHDKK